MERVHKSHNLSAILRNCDAVGVLEAHAVRPKDGLSLYGHTSAGTSKWVKVRQYARTPDAVGELRSRGMRIVAAHPGPDSADFRTVDFTRPTALMVGAELLGLSDGALDLADERVVIPMMGMVQSFNVSVAVALVLFEAFRQRHEVGMYETSRLDPDDFDRILFEWAYPRISRHYRKQGTPYPVLAEDGSISLPS